LKNLQLGAENLLETRHLDPDKTTEETSVPCKKCGKAYLYKELKEKEQEARLILEKAYSMFRTGDAVEAGSLLTSKLVAGPPSKWLHPYHCYMFNAYLAMVGACREKEDFEGQVKYCKFVIQALTHIGLSNHAELADAYYSLGEGYLGLAHSCEEEITKLLTSPSSASEDTKKSSSSSSSSKKEEKKNDDDDDNNEENSEEGPSKAEKNRVKRQAKKTIEKLRDDKEKWLLEAKTAYEKCLSRRLVCFGQKHDLTKASNNRVQELTPKKEKTGTSGKKKQGRRKK